jgi:hypothetical protein
MLCAPAYAGLDLDAAGAGVDAGPDAADASDIKDAPGDG